MIIPLEVIRQRKLTYEEVRAQTPPGVNFAYGKREETTQEDLDTLLEMLRGFMERHGIPVEQKE